jgi:hypothetical protein
MNICGRLSFGSKSCGQTDKQDAGDRWLSSQHQGIALRVKRKWRLKTKKQDEPRGKRNVLLVVEFYMCARKSALLAQS